MPGNVLITQKVGNVASQALGILRWQTMLPRLLTYDFGTSGSLAKGDTVNIPKPATLTAAAFNRTNGIVTQDIVESSIPVVLSNIWDVSVVLKDEQLLLDLTNFGRQVTEPAVRAIAGKMETEAVALLKSTTTSVKTVSRTDPIGSLIEATATLNQAQVDPGGRTLIVGTTLAAYIKKNPSLLNASQSNSDGALRDASMGRLVGCETYESPYVAADEGYIFGREAAVFVTRALTSLGSEYTVASTFESVALRTSIAHDINKKQTVASFDTLQGAKVLDDARIVPLKLAAS